MRREAYIKDADAGYKNCPKWLQNAEVATLAFETQSLPHSHPEVTKEQIQNFLSQMWTSYTKPAFQVSERGVHHTHVWRTWDLDFEANKTVFHQVMRKARVQNRDTWISRKTFQKEIKRQSLFMVRDDRTSKRPSLIMTKASSYPKKNSQEVGLYLSRLKVHQEGGVNRWWLI